MVAEEPDAATENIISGGSYYGPVFQGRDFDVTVRSTAVVPTALAQLPPRVAGFTGRDDELAVLAGLLNDDELAVLAELLNPAEAAGTVVVSAVAGLPGVGKTTLAARPGMLPARRAGIGAG